MPRSRKRNEPQKPTLGSLFAGIGGFDLGFERAGWRTVWQVEIDEINRAVLADRFPDAARFADVRDVGAETLLPVDCIAGGFPCQDISNMGSRRKEGIQGLAGERSGLFHELIRIVGEVRPRWVVFENVPALLHTQDGHDFKTVIHSLRELGYMGGWRVLDSQYFGVPQRRRRLFVVAGLGCNPAPELLADARPVEAIPCAFGQSEKPWRPADDWAGHTQTATNRKCRIAFGCEVFIAEEDGWHQMVERARASRKDRLCLGLDEANLKEAWSAGNAVCPHVVEWIARKLLTIHQLN